jgi:TP901 family phage tail tape measure protein
MFEAYSVAVKLSLVDKVSEGLVILSRSMKAAGVNATDLQNRIDAIGKQMKLGATLFGGGVAMAAPFLFAIDKAAELQKQMIGIQVATRGTTKDMTDMRHAIEDVSSRTVFSNLDVSSMAKIIATGTGLGAKDVTGLLPAYAKFADVQMLMKGTGYQQSVTEAVRLAHTAQHYDPKSLGSYLDLMTKASFIVPGSLSEVGHALKYSQGIAKTALGMDDEQTVLMTALLNRLGFAGSRGGTNLIAAFTRSIPGVFGSGLLKGKSGKALSSMGMVDAHGHSTVFTNGKFDSFKWIGRLGEYVSREFAAHPEAIARQDIMKNLQFAFGTNGSRVASLLSDPKALDQLRNIGKAFNGYGGVDAIQEKFANESAEQGWMNAKTNFVTAMTEIGYTLLPAATNALKSLNGALQSSIAWISSNQETVGKFAKGVLYLSAAMTGAGLVNMLLATGKAFRLLAIVMGAGGVVGKLESFSGVINSRLTAIVTGAMSTVGELVMLGLRAIPVVGWVALAVTAGIWLVRNYKTVWAVLKPILSAIWSGLETVVRGVFGLFDIGRQFFGWIGDQWKFLFQKIASLFGLNVGSSAPAPARSPYVPPAGTRWNQRPADVYLDGRKVGKVVAGHIGEEMTRWNYIGGHGGFVTQPLPAAIK